jgi:oxygen-independent coproporphyrinogen-3 oxidase
MHPELLTVDPEQILRHSGAGPRYTSYPTVPVWRPEVGADEAEEAYRRAARATREPLSLYVHLPFCERRCLFCGCTVEITRRHDRVEHYLASLEREVARVAELLGERRTLTQLHWGGGTPTHLDVEQLRRVFGAVTDHFELAPGAEVSLEVHPHVTTLEQVDALFELGFRRISMGVQDVDETVQAVVHRDQTLEETERLISWCRERGAEGINVDLMYGLPEQTEETFAATLDAVDALKPDRLAVYGYAHVPWLKKTQRALERHTLPDAVLRAKLFAVAVERLGRSGYEVIGLDHFALSSDDLYASLEDGTLHRNFMGYTTQRAGDMVALGMSAIADVGGTFLQNAHATEDYQREVDAGRLPTMRGLVRSPEDDLRRSAIQALMCRMRLDLDELGEEHGRDDLVDHFREEWERLRPFEAEGFCRVEDRRVEVLPRGRLFLRHLAMVFDAYLEPRPDEERFSQTV